MNLIRLPRLLLMATLLLLLPRLGWSQGATTAAMSGVITDSKGEGLPGATVIAVHTPTNTQYVSPTNSDGRFNIQNMRVGGPYTVKITFVGYQDVTRSGINLTLAENFRLDIKLSEATTSLEEVVVSGRQNSVINADRTGAATTVQRETIERLPTLSRSFNDFTRLTPQANGNSFGGRNTGFNNITIDGAIFNNSFGLSGTVGGQAGAQPISLDAIDQIQVSIAPFDVRQGSFTGAGINAVTRSGTNKFQGSVYTFYRDQDLVGNKVGDVKSDFPAFDLKNFGFRLGGPIVKDKLFFFVNAERELRNAPPGGNFRARQAGQALDATTSAATAQDLNALSGFLQDRYQFSTGAYENYSLRQNSDKVTARLDWNITQNHRFNIKYNYLKSFADVQPSGSGSINSSLGRGQSQFGLPYQAAYYTINNNLNSLIAELNSSFGGRFSNNLTAGFSAFRDFRSSFSTPFPFVEIGNATGLTAPSPAGPTAAANNQPNATLTSFGTEPFTAGNILDTDVFQIGDNFTAYLGKHNVTLGTYNEFYKFRNGFAPNFNGFYRFNSLEDFYSANGYSYDRATGTSAPYSATNPSPYGTLPSGEFRLAAPSIFRQQYSATPDGQFPYARITAQQFGLYVQDEYSPLNNLKITYGIRADLPVVGRTGDNTLPENKNVSALTFRDGVRLNTAQTPETKVLFSPRIGVNWDVNDDKKTQLRGGTGIFTGRIPFVLVSNQASNNGVLFGSIDATASANPNYQGSLPGATPFAAPSPTLAFPFSPNINRYRPAAGVAQANTAYNLAVTAQNFKFPQVWRTNIAVDQELFGGIVGTLEALYTKDLNALAFENVNLPNAVGRSAGPDSRPIFYTLGSTPNATGLVSQTANARIYGLIPAPNPNPNGLANGNTAARPNISDAILMRNTNKGYSYSVTGQLQRSFSNGLFAMLAYTYTDSRSVNDGGSTPTNIWRDRFVSGDPNANVLSYSSYLAQHRVIASASYRKAYLKHFATTLSLFYSGAPNGSFSRVSYTYAGDMNGDGQNNDLIYVPRNRSEIQLQDFAINDNRGNRVGTYTADQQYADLDAYINQDDYLKNRRGNYAERNGGQNPWQHQIDLRLLQDVFTNIGENNNTLQLSLDVFNFGNLLNSNWGRAQVVNRAQLLSFRGYDSQSRPVFQYPYLTNPTVSAATPIPGTTPQQFTPGAITTPGAALNNSFRDNTNGLDSRWQMQIGIRYIFN